MIKLIGFDLDDTLLNSKREIDDLDLLSTLPKKGVRLCLVSGRPLSDIARGWYKDLGESSDALYVAYNGATIYNLKGDALFKNHLSHSDVLEIVDLLQRVIDENFKDTNTFISMHKDGRVLCSGYNEYVDVEKVYNNMPVDVCNFWEIDQTAEKVMVDGDPDIIAKMFEMVEPILSKKYKTFISKPFYIEVLKKEVNKYEGLVNVAKLYGIKEDEIMAFGDAMNDYDMVKNAYLSVCMGNGVDELKKVAKYVTDTNDNHGIVKALKHFNIL